MTWMTVRQVAEYLQMSRDKIYDMAQKGEVPAAKIRQQWRFRRDLLDAWLAEKMNGAGTAGGSKR